MNFFFSVHANSINCRLQIPKFTNKLEKEDEGINLYSLTIQNKMWKVSLVDCNQDNEFYYISDRNLNNKKFFFIGKKAGVEKLKKNNYSELLNFDDYTKTDPAYRANLEIFNAYGGFSSYQSDYPFSMTLKRGGILSPLSTLLNIEADKNIIFFKNIYFKPVQEIFEYYIVDVVEKKLLKTGSIITNTTNVIEVDKELISKNIFFLTKDFIGIPIFCSIKNNHMSFEHTHPPHHYIWGKDKFTKVKELKERCYEIIS
jgi:hypothetical protein